MYTGMGRRLEEMKGELNGIKGPEPLQMLENITRL